MSGDMIVDTALEEQRLVERAGTGALPQVSVVTLVQDEGLYGISRETLAEQHPDGEVEWLPVRADAAGWNAAQGLNAGLAQARGEWVVCAHQDVLFPEGWWARARRQLNEHIAVAGLVGVTGASRFYGHVLEPRGHQRWGPLPAAVCSLDEHVLIVRRASGLRFDPETPGFHCYGTDLAMTAREAGLGVVVIDAPVVHLSAGRLDGTFEEAGRWLLAKWGHRMGGVIPTPAAVISAHGKLYPRRVYVWARRRWSTRARRCGCGMFRVGGERKSEARAQ